MINKHLERCSTSGLPWWYSGEKSACRGNRFDSWSGTIPHVLKQLSPQTTAADPTRRTAHALQQEKPPRWEAHALQRRPSAANTKPED